MRIRSGRPMPSVSLTGVQVKVTKERYPLAQTQEHRSMEGRDLFREGTRALPA